MGEMGIVLRQTENLVGTRRRDKISIMVINHYLMLKRLLDHKY
jgi:hypothetical protein